MRYFTTRHVLILLCLFIPNYILAAEDDGEVIVIVDTGPCGAFENCVDFGKPGDPNWGFGIADDLICDLIPYVCSPGGGDEKDSCQTCVEKIDWKHQDAHDECLYKGYTPGPGETCPLGTKSNGDCSGANDVCNGVLDQTQGCVTPTDFSENKEYCEQIYNACFQSVTPSINIQCSAFAAAEVELDRQKCQDICRGAVNPIIVTPYFGNDSQLLKVIQFLKVPEGAPVLRDLEGIGMPSISKGPVLLRSVNRAQRLRLRDLAKYDSTYQQKGVQIAWIINFGLNSREELSLKKNGITILGKEFLSELEVLRLNYR